MDSSPERPIESPHTSRGLEEPPTPVTLVRSDDGTAQEVDDPDKKHRRKIETDKLRFSFWLIGSCIALAVLLSVVERYVPTSVADEPGFSTIIDLLKLIATAVMGYVFGRSNSQEE
jgi:hypothetical protein